MSSYIIAGSADKFDTSECENLANTIKTYYPDISFKIVLKDTSEWEQYIDEICRIYGFKSKSNPIVYTMDGKLIGDRSAFVQLAEQRFGVCNPKLRQGPITPDINKKLAKQDLDRKTKEKLGKKTMMEKIEKMTLDLLVKNVIKPNDGYFEPSFTNGINVYLKYEERLCPQFILQKVINVEDELQVAEEEDYVLAEVVGPDGTKEVKKVPMFADRFITIEYQQMVMQQLQAQEAQSVMNTNEREKSQAGQITQNESVTHKEGNNTTIQEKQEENFTQDDVQGEFGGENQMQTQEDGVHTAQELTARPETAPIYIETTEATPETFKINHLIVHKFRNGYTLIMHPIALVEGQYILLNPLRRPGRTPEDEPQFFIQDYSKVIRGRYNSYKAMLKSQEGHYQVEGLYEPQLDIFKCLTLMDCEILVKLITKVDAIISLNILPQNLTSFQTLSNGHINVVLRRFALLQTQNEHLLAALSSNDNASAQQDGKQLLPLEDFILSQKSKCYSLHKNVYQLKGLDFHHFIAFPEKMLTAEQTLENIKSLFTSYLEKEPNAPLKMGFSLLISKYIIFFYPTYKSYDVINNQDVHLPTFASLGFLNLPHNVNIDVQKPYNYFELLKTSQKR